MVDITKYTEAKSSQLNAADLVGSPKNIKIDKVVVTKGE